MEIVNMANFTKDFFYELCQKPSRESFRNFLQNSTGEMNDIDFKTQLIADSKLAKHVLGIANYGGGAIVFGVEQTNEGNLNFHGVGSILDKADINKKLSTFLPRNLIYEIHEFIFDSSEYEKLIDKKFQMILISDTPAELPFFSNKDGKDIKKDDIYYRDGTNTIKADTSQIKKILSRFIRTQTAESDLSLDKHFEQLKFMYTLINKDKQILMSQSDGLIKTDFSNLINTIESIYGRREYEYVLNEYYPAESFEEFVSNCIQSKKNKIKAIIEIL